MKIIKAFSILCTLLSLNILVSSIARANDVDDLFKAINDGNFDTVQELITKNKNLVTVAPRPHACQTPLHDAAHMNRLEIAALLIKHGAKVDEQDENGYSPLDFATTDAMRNLLKGKKTLPEKKTVTFSSRTCFPVAPPQPFNFTQNKNWCWMTAALQCFYRVEEFRNTLKKIVAQNISPNNSAYEPWIFFKKLDDLFSRMETERSDLSSFYDFVFTKKRPEHEIIMQKKFLQDYFDKVQNKFKNTSDDNYITYLTFKNMIIHSSLKDLTEKYGEQNEPFKFIIFVYAALKFFAHLQPSEQLIQWTSSDFIGCGVDNSENIHQLIESKKSSAILIIHNDEDEVLSEVIDIKGVLFELIGICMHLPGHYIALVKYGNQWIKLDSCGSSDGEKKGENYSEILSELAKASTRPTQYFYQKKQKLNNTNDPLKLKLADMKKKLTMLSTKLKDLSQALANLLRKLKLKSL